MPFVATIAPTAAQGSVREMYDQVLAEQGTVPNWAHLFSLRPAVRGAWAGLLASIRQNMTLRRYELVTLAAARALHSSYCSLAHGRILATKVLEPAAVERIMRRDGDALLEPGEVAMMAFAEKLVARADQITQRDVDELRGHGLSDEEIFDVAATAAARCFFSKLLDALGAQADSSFNELDPTLRAVLTVGRPVSAAPATAER